MNGNPAWKSTPVAGILEHKKNMEQHRGGGVRVSTKRSRFLLFIVGCAMAWCLIIGQRLALRAHSSTDISQLRNSLLEITQHVEDLEAAQGRGRRGRGVGQQLTEQNVIALNQTSETSHLRNSIKILLEGLSVNEDNGIKPLIMKNVIRRKAIRLDKSDIVMVTQLSPSKFNNLLVQMKYWNGPASVAIYLKSIEDIDTFFDLIDQKAEYIDQVSFHLVLEKTRLLYYPVNLLRQVAMETVESHYYLAMDVDLIPLPSDCHKKLSATYANIERADKKWTLFVLPAFSLYPQKGETTASEHRLPMSKQEVRKMVNKREMGQFWKKEGFPQGHRPTSNEIWLKGESADAYYNISISRRESTEYEPYILGFKPGIPRYWDGKNHAKVVWPNRQATNSTDLFFLPILYFSEFRGFGYNKISFLHELYLMGYRYAVLYDFYCVHLDHPRGTFRGWKKNHTKLNKGIWETWHRDVLWEKHGRKR
eukprot:scaffold3840_cov129-Cylindrotheca_fusiformis.AAC.8